MWLTPLIDGTLRPLATHIVGMLVTKDTKIRMYTPLCGSPPSLVTVYLDHIAYSYSSKTLEVGGSLLIGSMCERSALFVNAAAILPQPSD